MGGIIVFGGVTFAWLLFKLPEFSHVLEFFTAIGRNVGLNDDRGDIAKVLLYCSPVLAYHLHGFLRARHPGWYRTDFQPAAFGVMLFLIITNSGSSSEFIYFQF